MTIRLGPNQYGKAETHLVRVTKGGPFGSVHEIKDISVSVALVGDFAGSHLTALAHGRRGEPKPRRSSFGLYALTI